MSGMRTEAQILDQARRIANRALLPCDDPKRDGTPCDKCVLAGALHVLSQYIVKRSEPAEMSGMEHILKRKCGSCGRQPMSIEWDFCPSCGRPLVWK